MNSVNNEPPLFTLFILILIISANFLGSLFPCRVQFLLKNNVFIKHLLGFFTMLFFVMLSSPVKMSNLMEVIKISLFMYILFIFVCKTTAYIFIIVFLLLGSSYLIILYDKHVNKTISNEDDEKKRLVSKNSLSYLKFLYLVIILLTIIGFIIYLGEKKIEYGKKFNYSNFLFGLPECKEMSPSVDINTAFKAAFK
jgi:hypothetical protein